VPIDATQPVLTYTGLGALVHSCRCGVCVRACVRWYAAPKKSDTLGRQAMVVFHLLTKLPKAHQKTIQKLNRATIVLGLLLPDSIRRLQSSLIAGSLEPGQPTNAAILVRL